LQNQDKYTIKGINTSIKDIQKEQVRINRKTKTIKGRFKWLLE